MNKLSHLGALMCLPLLAGCSFFMVPMPPSDPSDRTPDAAEQCTTSYVGPGGDTALALVGALNIGIAASASSGEQVRWYTAEIDRGTGIALGTAQLTAFGAAAVYGFVQVARCKALRKEVEASNGRQPPSQGGPPPDEYVTE